MFYSHSIKRTYRFVIQKHCQCPAGNSLAPEFTAQPIPNFTMTFQIEANHIACYLAVVEYRFVNRIWIGEILCPMSHKRIPLTSREGRHLIGNWIVLLLEEYRQVIVNYIAEKNFHY